jgi:hypothetical protein
VLAKIEEVISDVEGIAKIQRDLGHLSIGSWDDFAFGIAIGRIYNSFHYQTRRTLGRNATEEEFAEFQDILQVRANKIREALSEVYLHHRRSS